MPPQFGTFLNKSFNADFLKFVNDLNRVANGLKRLGEEGSFMAAGIIAESYKEHLRRGVKPELSNLTKALTSDHPPLSTLADHVIVKRGAQNTARVAFERGWARRALMLDQGFEIVPDDQLRAFLFMEVRKLYGNNTSTADIFGGSQNSEKQSTWAVPSRPHLSFFRAPGLADIMRPIARHFIEGIPLPPVVVSLSKFKSPKRSYGQFGLPGAPSGGQRSTQPSPKATRQQRKTGALGRRRRKGGRQFKAVRRRTRDGIN